jgi:hypothetical protein
MSSYDRFAPESFEDFKARGKTAEEVAHAQRIRPITTPKPDDVRRDLNEAHGFTTGEHSFKPAKNPPLSPTAKVMFLIGEDVLRETARSHQFGNPLTDEQHAQLARDAKAEETTEGRIFTDSLNHQARNPHD